MDVVVNQTVTWETTLKTAENHNREKEIILDFGSRFLNDRAQNHCDSMNNT